MFTCKRHTSALLCLTLALGACAVPPKIGTNEIKSVPPYYDRHDNSTLAPTIKWRDFFPDQNLVSLIDTALKNNQEVKITLQELEIARNEIGFRQGRLLPGVGASIGVGVDKVGRYTSQGAGDASTQISPGEEFPDPLTDLRGIVYANWEIDIWRKLHNAKSAAVNRYLSTMEGKNFLLTNIVAEIANSYYELLALDSELEIVRQNIELQKNALEVVKIQKEAAAVSELAVQKFEAEVWNSQGREFDLLQKIRETENKINLLLGRYPQPIPRDKNNFLTLVPSLVDRGIPSQLLVNRPDIKQAELDLIAAKLDVKAARAEFYPSFEMSAAVGLEAFKPTYLSKMPESLLYSLAGDLVGPLINRKAIKAEFNNANARQLQAMYNYERSILNAYLEVVSQLSKIDNLEKTFDVKSKEVDALTRSTDIASILFASARADYLEVLMTQRDALKSKLELVETKKEQLMAVVNVYRDLGGGWQ